MKNVYELKFNANVSDYGNLIPIESSQNVFWGGKGIPFLIKRVYYIYNVPSDIRRGFHAHINLHQVLICIHGSVNILTKTPFEEKTTILNNPMKGLYIGPMIWREMYDFSDDAVLLVLASEHYSESDYIRDYSKFEVLARKNFKEVE